MTERAAIASAVWMGRGDERSADQAAVDAMRQALNVLDIDGTVVIGEGERDEAPMLYIGERVGSGNGPRVDIALDPLEGTTITATGGPNAIACLAIGGEGGFLNAPDTYMDKIAVGGGLPEGVVHIEASPAENLRQSGQGQGRRGERSGGPDPRSAAAPGADRRGAPGRRPDPADPRRRRRRRDRHRAAGQRHRHLHGHRRRARGRARRGGAALDRRPDAGQAAFSQRRREGARAAHGDHRSGARLRSPRPRGRRRDVRRDRRDRRHHAARRAALCRRRDHPFDHDALEDRHRAPDRDRALHRRASARSCRSSPPERIRPIRRRRRSSARSAAGAGAGASTTRRRRSRSASASTCRRSSAACWPGAASRSTACRRSWRRKLRDALPDPSHLLRSRRRGRAARGCGAGGRARSACSATTTSTAPPRSRFWPAISPPSARRPRSTCRTACARATGPMRRRCERLAGKGCRLVVTLDCGTTAFEPLAAAAARGQQIIVVDHHVAEAELPAALAVINPNRRDQVSPVGELAAVGVTFLVVVALNRALRARGHFARRPEPDLRRWLDLVALGTICDVVPLAGLNRALVAQGLRVAARGANPGLAALARAARIAWPPSAEHCALRARAAPQCRRPHRLLPSCRRAADQRRAGRGRGRDRAAAGAPERGAAPARAPAGRRGRGADRRRAGARRAAAAGRGRGLVAGRARPGRRAPDRALPPADGGDRPRGWHRQGFGALGRRLRSRQRGDRGAPGRAAGAGRRPSDGGRADRRGGQAARRSKPFLAERLAGVPGLGRPAPPDLALDGALQLAGLSFELAERLARSPRSGAATRSRASCCATRAPRRCARWAMPTSTARLYDPAGGGRVRAVAFRALDQPLGRALLQGDGAPLHLAGSIQLDWWQGQPRVTFRIEDAATA